MVVTSCFHSGLGQVSACSHLPVGQVSACSHLPVPFIYSRGLQLLTYFSLVLACVLLLLLVWQVFMLSADRQLDESTLQEILISGHSRIPLHEPADRWAKQL